MPSQNSVVKHFKINAVFCLYLKLMNEIKMWTGQK